jgi:hypothetical protein
MTKAMINQPVAPVPAPAATATADAQLDDQISDEWIEEWDGQGHKRMKLDRSKFGHFIKNFGRLHVDMHVVIFYMTKFFCKISSCQRYTVIVNYNNGSVFSPFYNDDCTLMHTDRSSTAIDYLSYQDSTTL